MTQRHLSRFAAKVEVEELPLSVYETRGWKKETVERFPKEWNETYNDYIYKVPVRTMTWEEAFETVNEKILQLEKDAAKKKGKKDGDQGTTLDLPPGEKGKKEDRKDERKAEREAASQAKKISTGNQKIAATAANALGPLNSLETALAKLLTRADAMSQEDSAGKRLCRQCLETAKAWKQQAHAAVTQQEVAKGSTEQEMALPPLPFDSPAVKTLCKQAAEGMKEVRSSFPKKEPKAKAAPKAAPAPENGEAAPKRRRVKTAE
eukprot:s5818_g3.t1